MKQVIKNLKELHGEETALGHMYLKSSEVAKGENKTEVADFLRNSAKECKARANEIEMMMKTLE
ncbi:hypothetical protein COU56_02610 [Candidatus Pacearchaeota archaeon CG10_big_fil_rev_8_21_14_0_10_31_9]|jgi:rubrerythrin|nr:MAG: hypothetical protein AUJ62_02285 [Candidatus Pacearchaeota archaeon CG1_02_32_21]PIN94390.1 MAG: hypothetical protein COU56_02610 [Candidatus Pacearchaeota archaeon CG10_big_fil_rev_8_21_14_0_10_31_9]PIZ83001.1 MAG: hypothetical protein COX97_01915 [Candidatus Pacearchaeota archaeon CG_4_10_14_0_2_um_filter_05_32_18]